MVLQFYFFPWISHGSPLDGSDGFQSLDVRTSGFVVGSLHVFSCVFSL